MYPTTTEPTRATIDRSACVAFGDRSACVAFGDDSLEFVDETEPTGEGADRAVRALDLTLHGQLVAESAGDPARSKTGPIGFQLHDHTTLAMFRNIRIQEITGK